MADFISKSLLKEKAALYGVELDEKALERFDIYGRLLVEWNEKINLTAITEPDEVVIKHFVDSLTVFSAIDIPEGAKQIRLYVDHVEYTGKNYDHADWAVAGFINNPTSN